MACGNASLSYCHRVLEWCFYLNDEVKGTFILNSVAVVGNEYVINFCGMQLLERIAPATENLKSKQIDFSLWYKPENYRTEL